jgi:hypothetical protein
VCTDQPTHDTYAPHAHTHTRILKKTNASISGNTAQWLLHGILDHTVDRLLPIVEAYQVRIAHFQDQVHLRGAAFGKKQTSEVMDTKLDLLWIHRRVALLKPLLKHLLRTVPPDLTLYYQVGGLPGGVCGLCRVVVWEWAWAMKKRADGVHRSPSYRSSCINLNDCEPHLSKTTPHRTSTTTWTAAWRASPS